MTSTPHVFAKQANLIISGLPPPTNNPIFSDSAPNPPGPEEGPRQAALASGVAPPLPGPEHGPGRAEETPGFPAQVVPADDPEATPSPPAATRCFLQTPPHPNFFRHHPQTSASQPPVICGIQAF